MSIQKKTTIQDIARHANVSVGTVDRVLHNRGSVMPEKKQRVEEAIKKLNYNPNALASTLAFKKQLLISALIPEATSFDGYWSLPKKGIELGVEKFKDFGLNLALQEFNLYDVSSFVKAAEAVLASNCQGVILAPIFKKESIDFIEKLEEKEISYVFIDLTIRNQNFLSYIGPHLKSSGLVAGKLFDSILNQNEELLVLNMRKEVENHSNVGIIEEGFRNYFEFNKGPKNRTIHTLNLNSMSKERVSGELKAFYKSHPNIKGVFVTNSRAHIAADFHREMKLDIKIIGFDLVNKNIDSVKNGAIDFLISQRPVFQGTTAVETFFNHFIYKKNPEKVQNVPLDIVIKENIDFYLHANN
jgi:LacI family transcriptional regulator